MGRTFRIFTFLLILFVLAGIGLVLVSWQVSPPLTHVEKVIPNDRFQQ